MWDELPQRLSGHAVLRMTYLDNNNYVSSVADNGGEENENG